MIILHESRHFREPGFFRTLFRALRKKSGKVKVDEDRPFPRYRDERSWHDSAWITCDGLRVFVDMSDHVFQFDPVALREADLYLKANLHREVATKVFDQEGWVNPGDRLQPFVFLAPGLPRCRQIRWLLEGSGLARKLRRPGTLFHVVGVYENLIRDGDPPPQVGERLAPSRMHFWIRYQFSKVLREHAPTGSTIRLVNRGDSSIVDGKWVLPSLPYRTFLLKVLRADALVLNTFPHALDPWKAFEAICLGVPIVSERDPLVEVPEIYKVISGIGRDEVLPGFGEFDQNCPLSEPASFRVLRWPGEERIREGWDKIIEDMRNVKKRNYRRAWARDFSRERLSDAAIARDFRQIVENCNRFSVSSHH